MSDSSKNADEQVKTYDYELLDDVYSNWNCEEPTETPEAVKKRKTKDMYNGFNEKGLLRRSAKLYSNNKEEIKKNHPLMIMVIVPV